ncbi:MAG: Ig-like domain-containing protein [Oscillibacter sp.]
MKIDTMKRGAALLVSAVLLLTVNAAALFGKEKTPAPAAEGAPIAHEIAIETYRGIPYQAQFLATDTQGEDVTFAVVTPPKRGTVTLDGVNFTYTPAPDKTGTDSFTYAATDSAGNVSLPATVTVSIGKVKSGVTYADTRDSAAAAAAQQLAETGVFTGANIGGQYYFEPTRTVSREEFLAMVLETAGAEVTEVTMTGFCDDAAIPAWAKAYAAAGLTAGVVRGSATAEGTAFRGREPITFNEAAAVMNRVLAVSDVNLAVWYADRDSVPDWAAQAVGNMESVSVLAAGSFGSEAMENSVTRGDAAQMLAAAQTLLDGERVGLFDWLG